MQEPRQDSGHSIQQYFIYVISGGRNVLRKFVEFCMEQKHLSLRLVTKA